MEENFIRYYFKPTGKLGQGNTMFNQTRTPMIEANIKKFRLFTACDYEFVNHLAGTKSEHKVGKTVSSSVGSGSVEVTTNSYFKFDGVNIFDYLYENGIEFTMEFEKLIKPFYTVYYHKEKIARIETAGVSLFPDDKKYAINIPARGYYRIDLNPDYAYFVFLVAFAVSRIETSI